MNLLEKTQNKIFKLTVVNRIKPNKNSSRSVHLNFMHSFRPIYYVSRCFGLMPFSIVSDLNGMALNPNVCAVDILWFITSISLYTILTVITYKNMGFAKAASVPFVLIFADDMILAIGLINAIILIILDMYNRSKLVDILKMFQIFDAEVS